MSATEAQVVWDSACRTADANVRETSQLKLVKDGEWIFVQHTRRVGAKWWAYSLATGERIKTGCMTMTEVRRFLYERNRANNPQVTVSSGPGRALSARRFSEKFSETL